MSNFFLSFIHFPLPSQRRTTLSTFPVRRIYSRRRKSTAWARHCSKTVAFLWAPSSVPHRRCTPRCHLHANMAVRVALAVVIIPPLWLISCALIYFSLVFTLVNGAPPFPKPMENSHIYPLCDILCVNETEARVMTKLCVDTLDECRIACKMILDKGCGAVILTMGEKGALFVNRLQALHVHVPHKITPVDTTVCCVVCRHTSTILIRIFFARSTGRWRFIYGSARILSGPFPTSFDRGANSTLQHDRLHHSNATRYTGKLSLQARASERFIYVTKGRTTAN